MKKIILIVLIMIAMVGCSQKNEELTNQYICSTEYIVEINSNPYEYTIYYEISVSQDGKVLSTLQRGHATFEYPIQAEEFYNELIRLNVSVQLQSEVRVVFVPIQPAPGIDENNIKDINEWILLMEKENNWNCVYNENIS